MARRDDAKTRALAASRTLNPRPEKVADPAFAPGSFFDPANLVQVKYEMVRQAETGGAGRPGRVGLRGSPASRCIPPERRCASKGWPGLIPGEPGPEEQQQAAGEVVSHLEELLAADPRLRAGGPGRRGRAAFRHHGAPALGGTRAAAPPGSPERCRAGRRGRPQKPTPSRPPCHRRTWWRAISSCATSRQAATPAAGVMAWACWRPRGWPAGWPRAPPCRRPRPSTAALPQR